MAEKLPVDDAALMAFVELKSYPKGHELLSAGQTSNYIFHILSGACRLLYNRDGREITTWFAFENETITTASYFSRVPGEECLQTLEPITCLQLSYSRQQQLFDQLPQADRYVRLQQEQLIIRLEDRIKGLLFRTAQERYDHLLTVFPTILLRVPHHMIASYLGIRPETLSRLRAKY